MVCDLYYLCKQPIYGEPHVSSPEIICCSTIFLVPGKKFMVFASFFGHQIFYFWEFFHFKIIMCHFLSYSLVYCFYFLLIQLQFYSTWSPLHNICSCALNSSMQDKTTDSFVFINYQLEISRKIKLSPIPCIFIQACLYLSIQCFFI